jgi:hypothetical protein
LSSAATDKELLFHALRATILAFGLIHTIHSQLLNDAAIIQAIWDP